MCTSHVQVQPDHTTLQSERTSNLLQLNGHKRFPSIILLDLLIAYLPSSAICLTRHLPYEKVTANVIIPLVYANSR